MDYVHWNSVNHGWVRRVADWSHFSFHAFMRRGIYPEDLGGKNVSSLAAGSNASDAVPFVHGILRVLKREDAKGRKSQLIEMHLSEYRVLREEQRTRLSMNSTMLNLIVLIIAGELAAYVQMTINEKQELFAPLILATPILTAPLTLFYYDNQLMIYRIGQYFSEELYPRINSLADVSSLAGVRAFGWDRFHVQKSTPLWFVALGRNLFFVLVTLGPVVIFFFLKTKAEDLLKPLPTHVTEVWDALSGNIQSWEYIVLWIDIVLVATVLIYLVYLGRVFRNVTGR